MLTPKQRILSALRGQPVDRIPYCPFLAYWWEFHQAELPMDSQLDFMEFIGADPLLRGMATLFSCKHNKARHLVLEESAAVRRYQYQTPLGDLTYSYRYARSSQTWFLTEHPVKELRDLEALQYLFDDLTVVPDSDSFETWAEKIGPRGLLVPVVGAIQPKSSFQSLVEFWIGTQELCYMLADDPQAVEDTLAYLRERNREGIRIACQTSAEAVISWEDTSTTNITPGMFRDYILPEIREWSGLLHQAGKLFLHHACGHIHDLLPLMAGSDIDALESIASPPTGNTTLPDARRALPSSIALVGGIEATELERLSAEQLEKVIQERLRALPETGFVLANSDSCPPGVSLDNLKLPAQIVRHIERSNG